MDSAVIPLPRHKNLSLVQTVDFFYPLVDNPKIMGKIALANVVSDMYAVGVTNIDKLSLIISSPTELTEQQRDVVIPLMVEGFKESAEEAQCVPSIRNIAINPWCILGGIASAVCSDDEIIFPKNAEVGDALVLTKPLGTQLATNAYLWMLEKNEKWDKLSASLTQQDIEESFTTAISSMTFLNKTGAVLMHKYEAHAATDVTGFGILGHAINLAKFQNKNLTFVIEKLPIIKNVRKIGEIVNQNKKLLSGKAVETSGGLLISLSLKHAQQFCLDYERMTANKQKAWIIGHVVTGEKDARLVEEPEFVDVSLC